MELTIALIVIGLMFLLLMAGILTFEVYLVSKLPHEITVKSTVDNYSMHLDDTFEPISDPYDDKGELKPDTPEGEINLDEIIREFSAFLLDEEVKVNG